MLTSFKRQAARNENWQQSTSNEEPLPSNQ